MLAVQVQSEPRPGCPTGHSRAPDRAEGKEASALPGRGRVSVFAAILQAACSGDPAGSTSALLPPHLKRWRQTSWGGRQGRPEQERTKWNPPSEKQNGSASTLLLRFSPALQEAPWHLCWLEGGPGASRSCPAFASGCRSLQSRGGPVPKCHSHNSLRGNVKLPQPQERLAATSTFCVPSNKFLPDTRAPEGVLEMLQWKAVLPRGPSRLSLTQPTPTSTSARPCLSLSDMPQEPGSATGRNIGRP